MNFIENIKNDIDLEINYQSDIKKILEEIDELKENELVKRYMELQKYDTSANRKFSKRSVTDIKNSIIEKHKYDQVSTNEIYFCLGKSYYGHKKDNGKYYIDNYMENSIPVAWYINIETYYVDSYLIPNYECEKFEKTHHVIFPQNFDSFDPYAEYFNVHRQFLYDAIDNGEEIAIKKILTKYNKKSPNL